MAVKGSLTATNNLTPEPDIRLCNSSNEVLAEMVSLILLLTTIAHEHCKVNVISKSTDGELGEFLPCSFEPDLIGGQFVRPAKSVSVFEYLGMCNVGWCNIIN